MLKFARTYEDLLICHQAEGKLEGDAIFQAPLGKLENPVFVQDSFAQPSELPEELRPIAGLTSFNLSKIKED
jgi:hypothetical protein